MIKKNIFYLSDKTDLYQCFSEVKNYAEMILEDKNKENDNLLFELNKIKSEMNILQQEISKLNARTDAICIKKSNVEQIENNSMENIELIKQVNEYKQKLSELINKLNEKEIDKRFELLCNDIIFFRDLLWSQKEYAEEIGNEKLVNVIVNNLKQMKTLFEKNNIKILDLEGDFDSKIQYVYKTEITENSKLNLKIKKTFREGYMYKETLIRPQEVIVYKFNK